MERKLSKICTSYGILFLTALIGFIPPSYAREFISSSAAPALAVDGDSLEIGAARIRLVGIDAPEYDQQCKDASGKLYPCGKMAADFLSALIENQTVRCNEHQKDRYNRSLCTCYVNNADINAELIRSGLAIVYLESPYAALEQKAKQLKSGIWSGIFMHPRLFRIIKEQHKKALSIN